MSRQPIDVAVDPSGTVDAVIKTILLTDKASSSPTTSLHHHAPQCYDLRLHEGGSVFLYPFNRLAHSDFAALSYLR